MKRLSRGPGERAAAEQVNVEMIHGLASVGTGVDDHAVAFVEVVGAGDAGGGPEQVAEQFAVAPGGLGHGDDVLARGDEDVDRRLRMDVCEGVAELILVEGGGGNAPFNDHAKEAAHGAFSLQERGGVGVSEAKKHSW